MIDEKGENLGVLRREEAFALAREHNIDLIEISPQAKPPVARLMSFDKYRYLKEKEQKKERLAQKSSGFKQVRITARAAQNDLLVRVKKVQEFFEEGYQVEIVMKLRGREKRNKDWAFQKMREFLKMIPVEYRVVSEPRFGGPGITAQIIKK